MYRNDNELVIKPLSRLFTMPATFAHYSLMGKPFSPSRGLRIFKVTRRCAIPQAHELSQTLC